MMDDDGVCKPVAWMQFGGGPEAGNGKMPLYSQECVDRLALQRDELWIENERLREFGSIGRCSTCRHWRRPQKEPGAENDIPVGICGLIPHFWDATDWRWDGTGRVLVDKYKGVAAFAQDCSDYGAHLKTMGHFGCVHWEPEKDEEVRSAPR